MFKTLTHSTLSLAFASAALAHHHFTVDTTSGNPGDKIVIVVGYEPDDTSVTLGTGGRALDSGLPLVMHAPETLAQTDNYGGWHSADELVLTSDYFFGTGRLDGGDFRYEIHAVTPVPATASAPGAILAWGDFSGSTLVPSALSSAPTRTGRAYDVGVGSHDHFQAFAISATGVYDVTLIAYDANGVYADSDPVVFRVATTCAADFNASGSITVQDIFDFLGSWFARSALADFNEDGAVSIQDIFDFLTAWFSKCA